MSNKREVEEHLSAAEIAERLHVDPSTIARWVKTGKLKGKKKFARRCVWWPASAVIKCLEDHEV